MFGAHSRTAPRLFSKAQDTLSDLYFEFSVPNDIQIIDSQFCLVCDNLGVFFSLPIESSLTKRGKFTVELVCDKHICSIFSYCLHFWLGEAGVNITWVYLASLISCLTSAVFIDGRCWRFCYSSLCLCSSMITNEQPVISSYFENFPYFVLFFSFFFFLVYVWIGYYLSEGY